MDLIANHYIRYWRRNQMLDLISVGLETIKDEDCLYADKSMTFSDSADIKYFIVHFQK